MKRFILAAATSVALMATGATAATLNGTFWDATPGSLSNINQAIAYAGTNTADATFTSTDIAYGDGVLNSGATVGSGLTNWAIGTLGDFLNADAPVPAASAALNFQESVIKLTGLVALNDGDLLSVTSDDGFRLIIGGSTVSEFVGIRAPNNPGNAGGTTAVSWAGGTGIFEATLWYFEGQQTQAQLVSNLGDYATVVPLPAGMVLMLTALGGFGIMRRRKAA